MTDVERLEIRSATTVDVAAIAALYAEAAEDAIEREPTLRRTPDVARLERTFTERTGAFDRGLLVALDDDRIVGFADVVFRPAEEDGSMHRPLPSARVELMMVARAYRNRGVGRRLVEAVEESARRRGARVVWLDTHVANVGARRFYERAGYRSAGVIYVKEV